MSLAGALCSFLAMWLCSRLPRCFSIYGVSLIGAAFHNLGQIGAACLLMRSTAVVYYLPLLLYAGLVTGSIKMCIRDSRKAGTAWGAHW